MHLFSLGDVSRIIGIPRHRIEYAIANGALQEPTLRLANKRVFTEQDVNQIAEYFGVTTEGENPKGESNDLQI